MLKLNFDIVRNPSSEDERYTSLVYHLSFVKNAISDPNVSITHLYEMCNSSKQITVYGSKSDCIKNDIEIIKNAFDELITDEDKIIHDILTNIINKYGLTNSNELVQKLNELMTNTDAINQLINDINTAYQCQKVSDINSLITFVRELVNNMANYSALQNNNNALFINLNATLAENATLKAQNEQLKQRLIALGQVV